MSQSLPIRDRRRTFLVATGAEATRGTVPEGKAEAAEASARRVLAKAGVTVAGHHRPREDRR